MLLRMNALPVEEQAFEGGEHIDAGEHECGEEEEVTVRSMFCVFVPERATTSVKGPIRVK